MNVSHIAKKGTRGGERINTEVGKWEKASVDENVNDEFLYFLKSLFLHFYSMT